MTIPPLPAIRAFEATARHLSFTRAAEELGMTQAGVSYQIRVLEEKLGGALFLRRPKGIELTALGQRLAAPTSEAFELLRDTFTSPADDTGTFSISTLPTFAGNWLSQRLGRFQMAHPHLAVRLDSQDRLVDFKREDFDVAVRHGLGKWPGLTAHKLFDIEFTPMLSPSLAEAAGAITTPADLVPMRWVDPSDPGWAIWLRDMGIDHPSCEARPGLRLGTQVHEARAAIAGAGIALLTPRFFRYELATGSLIQPFPHLSRDGKSYWLVYPTPRRNHPAIRAFRAFLNSEIAAEDMMAPTPIAPSSPRPR
ncbi:LysR substrate-binding domain-containing protein [Paracoccus pacificus]|uniref:LysR substrate-binding domain-containing protein n=1 Tax=Paracoccus pacificus TaxID=1463598 RepID=A0ABW4RDJ6_9RHOB